MSAISSKFRPHAQGTNESIAVFGGGLSAIFSAYHLKEKARLCGKQLDVILGAKEINTPCSAGNHTLRVIEGMFEGPRDDMGRLSSMLKSGLEDLQRTIADKNLSCRHRPGYEIKGERPEDLERIVSYMIQTGILRPDEIILNSGHQRFLFPGYPHSVAMDSQGQLNMPELLRSILAEIGKMNGETHIGMEYISHARMEDGKYLIRTDRGDIVSTLKPLIATGAEHQRGLKNSPFTTNVSYTMAFVLGPLSDGDAGKVAPGGPVGFCTSELDGDFIWGGLDAENYFTLGCGDIYDPTPQDRRKLETHIRDLIDTKYPGLVDRYPPRVTFGPMLVTLNKMPIVERLPGYDIIGGWAGMGIVAGWTAASAYAEWIVNSDARDLRFFESLQPAFAAAPAFVPGMAKTF